MFTKNITDYQEWKKEKNYFEPDSSPEAWEHYKKYYLTDMIRENYDFDNLYFYNNYQELKLKTGYKSHGEWFNYIDSPKDCNSKKLANENYNRLFAIAKDVKPVSHPENGLKYIKAANRLAGDCDFNFNDKKYHMFVEIIKSDIIASQREKDEAMEQLLRCRKMHHTLLNFSLMQSIGNMQKFKGSNRFDRLDTFVSVLHNYFCGISNEILRCASLSNEPSLKSFLNGFKSIYDYCKTFYFIDNKEFIDELIRQGNMPITNINELVRYMNLAEKFWMLKEFYFKKAEEIVGSYFQDGGETYAEKELLEMIKNDLDFDESKGKRLLERCSDLGFIVESVSGLYTR